MYAMTRSDLPGIETLRSVSGLDYMQGILDGRFPGPAIGQLLNYGLTEARDGVAVFEGTPEFIHSNPTGGTHGGWYGTLLDSCMSCAVWTRVPKGQFYTTLEYKVNLTRAIPEGTTIVATGTCDHVGRSTGVAHGEIRGKEDGKLYATGTVTCLILTL